MPRSQRLFGGQIVGQALVAAAKSVGDHLYAHSLHCYFVRAGKMFYHFKQSTLNIQKWKKVRAVVAICLLQLVLAGFSLDFHTLDYH